jgi:hypothetical protein
MGEAVGTDGYEVLQGAYGLNNFTSGTALWLELHLPRSELRGATSALCLWSGGGGGNGDLN